MFEPLIDALGIIFLPQNVIAMVIGVIGGIMFGAMPGLTGSSGISMLIPLTFGMNPLVAMSVIAGLHNGGNYGGAIPAVLLKIPGTPGAIVTTFDGYPMSQQGYTARALKLAALSSAMGGMISALALMLLAPPLAKVALAFGPAEVFWLCFFGLSSIAVLLSDDPIKGLLAGCFGVMVSLVGQDLANGYERYNFGLLELADGIALLVIMVGMYALTPCWEMGERAQKTGIDKEVLNISGTDRLADWPWRDILFGWLRAIPLGIGIGILPGVGGLAASFIAYNAAKTSSRNPESFGNGNPAGVAISESANNADNAASMIPALTLAIPGSGAAALILGGLMVHGLQPGPDLFVEAPDVVFGYMWAMMITSAMIILFGGVMATRIFANILLVPQVLLMPLIVCVCVVGIYSYRNDVSDAYIMFAFGFVGYAFSRLEFPIAPVILGLVLGDKAEFNFRTALKIGLGDWKVLLDSGISIALASLVFLVLIYPAIQALRKRKRSKSDKAG